MINICEGVFYGGSLKDGTFHGGEIEPGTFHDSLCPEEFLDTNPHLSDVDETRVPQANLVGDEIESDHNNNPDE